VPLIAFAERHTYFNLSPHETKHSICRKFQIISTQHHQGHAYHRNRHDQYRSQQRDAAGNWNSNATHYGPFFIDGTAPTNPTVTSDSHSFFTWSADNIIDVSWSGASV